MEWCTLGRPGSQKPGKGPGRLQQSLWRARFLRICLAAGMIIIVLGLLGYAWAKKKVTLVVDGREMQVQTYSRTVADLLKNQGITFSSADQIDPSLDTSLKENLRVVVNHAVRVTLTADGQTKEILTCRNTVGDVLQEQGIPVKPGDLVEPAPDSSVAEGMEIKVVRVHTEEEVKEVPVACPTRREIDPHLAKGFSRVVQAGKDGLEKQRWQIVYHDGREVERRLIGSTLVREPVERVIRVGALQQVSRGGQNIRFSRALDVIATAYTYTGHNTASGIPPHFGAIAVDPQVIPLGSRLYVEGYGFARALDTGGAIKGNRIDVFFETKEQTRRWGIRRVRVYILE